LETLSPRTTERSSHGIPEKIRAAVALVANHQLRVPIAAVYPARRFEQALAHALAGGKVLLDFG
jgi:NADPH:quinone reductase-like Zn-dependent oxidoreductase